MWHDTGQSTCPNRARRGSTVAGLQSTNDGGGEALGRLGRLTYRTARRITVAIVGTTLLVLGVVLVFTPGPAIVVLSLGLAVLAVEFAWARRWLRKLKETAGNTVRRVRGVDEDAGDDRGQGSAAP